MSYNIRIMSENYRAKISIRSGDNLCVRIPKKILKDNTLKFGDVVDVSIQKLEGDSNVSRD